jgi:hypothetical protein
VLAYNHTPEKSKLRKFMLDWYLAEVKADFLEVNIGGMPDKFVKDLAVGFCKAAVSGVRPKSAQSCEKCEYHIHNDEAPKCSSG